MRRVPSVGSPRHLAPTSLDAVLPAFSIVMYLRLYKCEQQTIVATFGMESAYEERLWRSHRREGGAGSLRHSSAARCAVYHEMAYEPVYDGTVFGWAWLDGIGGFPFSKEKKEPVGERSVGRFAPVLSPLHLPDGLSALFLVSTFPSFLCLICCVKRPHCPEGIRWRMGTDREY